MVINYEMANAIKLAFLDECGKNEKEVLKRLRTEKYLDVVIILYRTLCNFVQKAVSCDIETYINVPNSMIEISLYADEVCICHKVLDPITLINIDFSLEQFIFLEYELIVDRLLECKGVA